MYVVWIFVIVGDTIAVNRGYTVDRDVPTFDQVTCSVQAHLVTKLMPIIVRVVRVAHLGFRMSLTITISAALTPSIFQFPGTSRASVHSILYISDYGDMSWASISKTNPKQTFTGGSAFRLILINEIGFLLLKSAMFFCSLSWW